VGQTIYWTRKKPTKKTETDKPIQRIDCIIASWSDEVFKLIIQAWHASSNGQTAQIKQHFFPSLVDAIRQKTFHPTNEQASEDSLQRLETFENMESTAPATPTSPGTT
jgi:hypothetical protein